MPTISAHTDTLATHAHGAPEVYPVRPAQETRQHVILFHWRWLPRAARRVLEVLDSYADRDGWCWPSSGDDRL